MRCVILLSLALVALASDEAGNVETPVRPTAFGYHDNYGIPRALELKQLEDAAIQRDGSRIVGGAIAWQNEIPYLGGLLISIIGAQNPSVCGSTLLSSNRLITAAHCWWDGNRWAWQFEVVLGSTMVFYGGNRIQTSQVIMHPQWTPSNLANDVAIIYLPNHVPFSPGIQAAFLPTGSLQLESFAGWWAKASGYGRTSDTSSVDHMTVTRHVDLRVISLQECLATYGSSVIMDSTLCTSGAGGIGVCSGDSGGPLVINNGGRNILIGVTSFAASIGGQTACALGFPSGFARVTSFSGWINSHLW